MELIPIGFYQPLVAHTVLPENVFKSFVSSSEKLGQPANQWLAGRIKDEHEIELDPIAKSWLLSTAKEYIITAASSGPYDISDEEKEYINGFTIYSNQIWVNHQRKHEVNPPHCHSGDMSYVIFVKIPYDLDDEFNEYPDGTLRNQSMFNFLYSNIVGEIQSMPMAVSKEWEGSALLFPSNLNHYVMPFVTSDDVRITIAGNVSVGPKEQ